jgi:flavin-dependent dehydrogenase
VNSATRKPKVVVIGAGPAGGAFALALARAGTADVTLLDQSSYPRVKACGSGLSPLALAVLKNLELLDALPEHASIRGLEAKGPGGKTLELAAGEGAWVVPRVDFDHALALSASAAGAIFHPETRVVGLLENGRGVAGVQTTRGAIEADLVVCADGAHSRFSRDVSPRNTVRTIMGWWAGTQLPRDRAIMIWDRELDGYYAWAFPEPNDIVNIGLCIPAAAPRASRLRELFERVLDEHFQDRMRGAEPRGRWLGHPAVISHRVGPIAESRALWIGEAARLVMPGTLEGIGFALQNGVAAAEFVSRELSAKGGLSTSARARYRMSTARSVLPKFWAGAAFAQAMRSRNVRGAVARLMNDRVRSLLENAAARVVGDETVAGSGGAPVAPVPRPRP